MITFKEFLHEAEAAPFDSAKFGKAVAEAVNWVQDTANSTSHVDADEGYVYIEMYAGSHVGAFKAVADEAKKLGIKKVWRTEKENQGDFHMYTLIMNDDIEIDVSEFKTAYNAAIESPRLKIK